MLYAHAPTAQLTVETGASFSYRTAAKSSMATDGGMAPALMPASKTPDEYAREHVLNAPFTPHAESATEPGDGLRKNARCDGSQDVASYAW
jgi:hypothetical protein